MTAFFLLFLTSFALKMVSGTSIEGDEFDDYSQGELRNHPGRLKM